MINYCTVQDVIDLWRPLTTAESGQAAAWIPIVSDCLRVEAKKAGKDLDAMLADRIELRNVARSVAVRAVASAISSAGSASGSDISQLAQFSQSALGYTYSGTVANPGGGIWFKKSELKQLGILKQRYGVLEFYGEGDCHA